MSIQIAVPFAPLGLDPNVYAGIAILTDTGIAKVGLAKVPYTPVLTSQFDSQSMEFVLNAAQTVCLSTSGDANFGPVNVLAAVVKWLPSPSSLMDPSGLAAPVIIGQLHTYAGQQVAPVVVDGYVMLLEGARQHGGSDYSAFYVGMRDDGTVFNGEIRNTDSLSSQVPWNLHVLANGNWMFALVNGFGSGATAQLVGGPVPAFTPLITTFWDNTQPALVMPQDPAAGQGLRFVGNAEYGLLASPCGPLSSQSNAYRNSDGTFTCYETAYNAGIDVYAPGANTYTGVAGTYTITANTGVLVNTSKQMCTDGGVQFDPDVMSFANWQEQQLHSAPPPPQTTLSYFWTELTQTAEQPVVITT